ncbi:hypothetical protein B0A52_05910 [Exophiala mesophila]|uniref:EthD domain-containing protein n=1 Tax=Exophiala mesophila TaxID=212818 RepID=A0A438N404_EXOME|nr:hypothetical protein B0A52_05910 [Exophiala mesophila]
MSTPASQEIYRISTLFHSRPGVSETEFYKHWYEVHGPLCVPWALHYNFVGYIQFQTPQHLREALGKGRDGQFKSSSGFEACADFYVRDYNDYLKAFQDPYYLEVIAQDEENFVDKGIERFGNREQGYNVGEVRAISTMGITKSIIKDGKAVIQVPDSVWKKWEEFQDRKRAG